MYVIKRIDQGGGYLTFPGSTHSYSKYLENARTFYTKEDAQKECCENEVVISIEHILNRRV